MKKILRFIIHNRKTIIKNLAIAGAAVAAYVLAHKTATVMRGYEAIGGEVFVPILIIFADEIWAMITEPFKSINNQRRGLYVQNF